MKKDDKDYEVLSKIPNFKKWKEIVKVEKGAGRTLKYRLKYKKNEFLLRITDEPLCNLKILVNNLSNIESKHAVIPRPFIFGEVNEKSYVLLNYVPGETLFDLKSKYDNLTPLTQYKMGLKIGAFLKDMHTVQEKNSKEYRENLSNHIKQQLKIFSESDCDFENKEKLINFIVRNINCIDDLPLSLSHFDIHAENIVVDEYLNMGIIDFEYLDFRIKYFDFKRIFNGMHRYRNFTSGMISGYLDGENPNDFFQLVCLFTAIFFMERLNKAQNAKCDIRIVKWQSRTNRLVEQFNGFESMIPKFYKKGEKIISKELEKELPQQSHLLMTDFGNIDSKILKILLEQPITNEKM